MKEARLLPLDGKYYGTEVRVTYDDNTSFRISITGTPTGQPSYRQYEQWGIKPSEVREDELGDYMADGHYESWQASAIAEVICMALINWGEL